MSRIPGIWHGHGTIPSTNFVCGHCGADITSNLGYYALDAGITRGYIYLCHYCNKPTLISSGRQAPAPKLGNTVDHLPKDIDDLYSEMRDTTAASSYTATVLLGRKLLMHIAVESGAKEGQKFLNYVDYLVDNHFTPPKSKVWVDKIRKLGNGANHDIVIMGQTEAKDILKFIEMILRFKYEFPGDGEETEVTDTP